MTSTYNGTFNVSLKNKNGLLETGKGWGLNLVYTGTDKVKHVVMVDYKHFDSIPNMEGIRNLVEQINHKHKTEGYFDQTLALYFGDDLNPVLPETQPEPEVKKDITKTIIIHGERVILTEETILKTRQHFADNGKGCIDEVLNGTVKVNDQDTYFKRCEQNIIDALAGKSDKTLAFIQHAYFIQSGESTPMFAD